MSSSLGVTCRSTCRPRIGKARSRGTSFGKRRTEGGAVVRGSILDRGEDDGPVGRPALGASCARHGARERLCERAKRRVAAHEPDVVTGEPRAVDRLGRAYRGGVALEPLAGGVEGADDGGEKVVRELLGLAR